MRYVTQGDFLRLLAYVVLLVGVWRAIHASELGRVVAEERARVAREIHDGLSQYLFAVSTHAAMLEAGADPGETIPKLKAAVQAAQTEARFATLALSSAAGRAPFDAALRRYVDFLTADGELEVELQIDAAVRLAPDEQIEVFRIVQEGLANARKHAHARRAWVTIGHRGDGPAGRGARRRLRLRAAGRCRGAGPPEHAPAGRGDRRCVLAPDGAGQRHRARSRAATVGRRPREAAGNPQPRSGRLPTPSAVRRSTLPGMFGSALLGAVIDLNGAPALRPPGLVPDLRTRTSS